MWLKEIVLYFSSYKLKPLRTQIYSRKICPMQVLSWELINKFVNFKITPHDYFVNTRPPNGNFPIRFFMLPLKSFTFKPNTFSKNISQHHSLNTQEYDLKQQTIFQFVNSLSEAPHLLFAVFYIPTGNVYFVV